MRARLVLLVMACMLPASLAVAVAMFAGYREGRAALLERAQAVAHAMMLGVDHELGDAIGQLQAMATAPALAAHDLAGFHALARRMLPYQEGDAVVLRDADGRQLLNTLVPWGAALPQEPEPAFGRRVFERGEPVVIDLFVGAVSKRQQVAVEVPVRMDGRIAYGLSMRFFPERMAMLLAGLQPDTEWVVAILDATGTVVARTHQPERFVGTPAAEGVRAAMAQADAGTVDSETLEGVPVLASFARSAQTGWSVVVGVPKEMLLARLERWLAGLALVTGGLCLIGVLAARQVARGIAGAIGALVEPAAALGQGRAVAIPPLALAEADDVADALTRAAKLLQARTAERDEAARSRDTLRSQAERLTHAAEHDPLTGLANRAAFLRALEQRLEASRRSRTPLTLFFVDLDDFKPVNDTHGHAVGDELLRAFATRLRAGVRESDVVARLGGDEFAVLVGGLGQQEALPLARALVERISQPYAVRQLSVRVSACIGVAGYPEAGATAQALLEAADGAMYRAKAAGKRHCSVWDLLPPGDAARA